VVKKEKKREKDRCDLLTTVAKCKQIEVPMREK